VGCTRVAGDCRASKKDLKEAEKSFRRALKLRESGRHAEALHEFETAAERVPYNIEYLTAREVARQQLVHDHLQKGNQLLLAKRRPEALAEFRSALQIDPDNNFAAQRLQDALAEFSPKPSQALRLLAQSDEIQLQPRPGQQDIRFRGDTRGLYNTIARLFGVRAAFDESVAARPVRLEVAKVDFYRAMRLTGQLTKTFWAAVSESELIVAANTPENHRRYERMSMRTFYLSDATSPQEMTEVVGALRSLFDIRFVSPQPAQGTVVVRAPKAVLDAATQMLEDLSGGPPQVMLDMQVFQVNRAMLRTLGINLPLQFTMFNLPTEARGLTGTPDIQQLIDQLFASGGINQTNTTAISALLAQLQSQQASIFAQPFAVFGGGITLFGLTIPPVTATASLNESSAVSLEHVTLRAMQGKPATLRVGSRFPVLNATFSPIFNSPELARVIQNQSFQTAFPSFNYEDLGITVKATPQLYGPNVTLNLETEIKSLLGQSFNGVPVISNRKFTGSITVKNGETAVVAGLISHQEQRSLRGLPGLGQIPGLGQLFSTENKQEEEAELLVVITPHLLTPSRPGGTEIWMAPTR
jgi:type II secretory pathway component GspD/PulD (secretin)